MRIAITGASGFIGKKLSHFLHERDHQVIALVRSEGKGEIFNKQGISIRIAELGDLNSLESAFKGVRSVIHLAALFNHPEASWDDYFKVNVEGTRNVLQAAMKAGVNRVVHCSTGGVVTGGGEPPYSENTPYAVPDWDKYETTKCEGEKAALYFCRENDFDVVIIRPAQPYGPGDVGKAKFYRLVKKGVIINPGTTKKHPVFIDDLCRAFEMAAIHPDIKGEIFNIGGRKVITLKELIGIVADALDVPKPRIILPSTLMTWLCTITEETCNFLKIKPILFRRSMDFFTKSVEFDVEKAKKELGFESVFDIGEGVSRTADWYKEQGLL